jgi:Tfp pilus assembly protein FimT
MNRAFTIIEVMILVVISCLVFSICYGNLRRLSEEEKAAMEAVEIREQKEDPNRPWYWDQVRGR